MFQEVSAIFEFSIIPNNFNQSENSGSVAKQLIFFFLGGGGVGVFAVGFASGVRGCVGFVVKALWLTVMNNEETDTWH